MPAYPALSAARSAAPTMPPSGTAEPTSSETELASLMVGAGWKTFPIYQAQTQNIDGRIASALAVLGLLFTFLISMILIFLSTRTRRGGTITAMANK